MDSRAGSNRRLPPFLTYLFSSTTATQHTVRGSSATHQSSSSSQPAATASPTSAATTITYFASSFLFALTILFIAQRHRQRTSLSRRSLSILFPRLPRPRAIQHSASAILPVYPRLISISITADISTARTTSPTSSPTSPVISSASLAAYVYCARAIARSSVHRVPHREPTYQDRKLICLTSRPDLAGPVHAPFC